MRSWITAASVLFVVASGTAACDDDDEAYISDEEASAACLDYCDKLFDCGITIPADQPADEYQLVCEGDCVDALTGATQGTVHFEIEHHCCPLECDVNLPCGEWYDCCDGCE